MLGVLPSPRTPQGRAARAERDLGFALRTLHDRSEAYRRVADYFSIELSQGHQVVGVFSAMFAVLLVVTVAYPQFFTPAVLCGPGLALPAVQRAASPAGQALPSSRASPGAALPPLAIAGRKLRSWRCGYRHGPPQCQVQI